MCIFTSGSSERFDPLTYMHPLYISMNTFANNSFCFCPRFWIDIIVSCCLTYLNTMKCFQSKLTSLVLLSIIFLAFTFSAQCAQANSEIEDNNNPGNQSPTIPAQETVPLDSNKKTARLISFSSGRSLLFKSLLLIPFGLTLLLIVALSILPIPVVTIPTPGRRAISNFYYSSARLAKDVLTSEECTERLSCEISRTVKNYGGSPEMFKSIMNALPMKNTWTEKIERAFSEQSVECNKHPCNINSKLKSLVKRFKQN